MSMKIQADEWRRRLSSAGRLSVAAMSCMAIGAGAAYAAGGTAKTPTPPGATPTVTILPAAGPQLPNISTATGPNGFQIDGFIQSATVDGGCVAGSTAGGTVTINGIVIKIPTETIVQYPANTATWNDAICGITATNPLVPSIGLDGLDGTPIPVVGPQPGPIYPSVEMRVDGNIVGVAAGPASTNPPGAGATHIGSLVFISQHSLNSGQGYIRFIDYADGSIYVQTKDALGNDSTARLLINDPNGRFGRAQSSTDARFSVDDANPTIKSGASGYPMCVPRTDPASADDPLCPAKNRPVSDGTTATCRNFAAANIAFRIPGADLIPNPAGQFCTGIVMKAIAGMPGTSTFTGVLASNIRGPNDPDPTQQAPFEIGDFITWQGTLVRDGQLQPGTPAPGAGAPATTNNDLIWVHTIDANVGIYTQPQTLPSYVAVGEFSIGVDPQPTGAAAVVGIETTDRLVLEANVSDVGSLVDIYTDDKGFALPAGNTTGPLAVSAGSEYFRWLTPEGMTGTLTDQAAGKLPFLTSDQTFGGGIQTQFTGPQPGRARIRAIKVPAINPALGACPLTAGSQACSVTQSPTRYVRVVVRELCAPASTGQIGANGVAVPSTNLDTGAAGAAAFSGPWFNINGPRASLTGAGAGTSGVPASNGTCLQSAQYANGLFTGQYMAPTTEFIFPENTLAGFPIVPANFWQLGFLAFGEGGDGSNGPQVPQPW